MAKRKPRNLGTTNCRDCGTEIVKRHPAHTYCNAACAYRWRSKNQRKPCEHPGCDGTAVPPVTLCSAHLSRKRSGRDMDAPIKRRRSWGVVCSVEGCDRSGGHGHGLCGAHAYRLKRHGDVMAHVPVKDMAPKGSGYVNSNGYRIINDRAEHRLVMEQQLGRALHPDEDVHHLNGDRLDNRPENLELWVVRRQPRGQRVADRVADALETLERYGPELLA